MKKITARLFGAMQNERGASAVEYALLVGLVAVAIITTVTLLGTQLNGMFRAVVTALGG